MAINLYRADIERIKYLIKTYGIDILVEVEEQLQKKKQLIH